MIGKAMLHRIRSLARGVRRPAAPGEREHDDLHLAVAVLLVEAARMDDHVDAAERATIRRLIGERLGLSEERAEALMAAAEEVARDMGELWSFARIVKDRFTYDERIGMMEMLWEVAYADGTLHDYEASLMRRIAGLIYVTDRDSGLARRRARERLGMEGAPGAG